MNFHVINLSKYVNTSFVQLQYYSKVYFCDKKRHIYILTAFFFTENTYQMWHIWVIIQIVFVNSNTVESICVRCTLIVSKEEKNSLHLSHQPFIKCKWHVHKWLWIKMLNIKGNAENVYIKFSFYTENAICIECNYLYIIAQIV